MAFRAGNKSAPRYYQDPDTGEKVSYEEMMTWDEGHVEDPWELRVYCSGCLAHGATVPLAKLEHVINIPARRRLEVGTLIRDSVGCPMSGRSHSKVVLRWARMDAAGCAAVEVADAA